MASSLTKDNIKFIAVARAASSDAAKVNLLLGSYVPPNFSTTEKVYHAMVTKVLQAPTWSEQVAPKSRHSLDCEDANHKFHFVVDSDFRVYMLGKVLISKGYTDSMGRFTTCIELSGCGRLPASSGVSGPR